MNLLPQNRTPVGGPTVEGTVQGRLRINQKNYRDAFLSCPNGGSDIYIENIVNRNVAMDGDIVNVRINTIDLWRVNFTTIINRWDEWSELLQPIITSIISENQINSENQHTSKPLNRQKRSVDNDDENKQAPNNSSKIPSNLPKEIARITPHHLMSLHQIYSECVQRTGYVESIVEYRHPRVAGGHLKPQKNDSNYAIFSPNDSRFPRMLIPIQQCPRDFQKSPNRYSNVLFVAQMNSWHGGQFALGDIIKLLGDTRSVEARVEAILYENQIDDSDFPPYVHESLLYSNNLTDNWSVPLIEYTYRRDLTNECVFTIDPKTARDLDDAVSIKELTSDIYEVGVHIADVSYFVDEFTAVDYHARIRATSVYLVERVIPMLPRILCERLCSLTPGEPKLTFSVIWKITKEGKILDQWFGRTIIRSCVKLAYEHAQDMIENRDNPYWIGEQLDMLQLHVFDYGHISKCVNMLNEVAINLRKKRFENGALKIDKIKLQFELDPKTGIPTGFSIQERKLANSLIEEFMLLANISVAQKIYQHYPDLGLLRRHPPSDARLLREVEEFCRIKDCPIDVTSSGSIARSLEEIESKDITMSKVISNLLLRAMKNAEYFCTGALGDVSLFKHYALNVPFYTHFTSPIRRYADIIVHRLLSSALNYTYRLCEDIDSLIAIADNCNKKKVAAKNVSEQSAKIYFNLFVKQCAPYEEIACVTRINDQSFDVMLVNCDEKGRIHINELVRHLNKFSFESHAGVRRLVLYWKHDDTIASTEEARLSSNSDEKGSKKGRRRNRKSKSKNQDKYTVIDNSKKFTTDTAEKEKVEDNLQVENSHKRHIQVIKVFDLVKIRLSVDDKDIMQLKINLKLPDFNKLS